VRGVIRRSSLRGNPSPRGRSTSHSADSTTEQYDESIRRLEKSGDWLPDGLEYHVAFKSNGNFRVSEIWDSQKQFDAFGERLMPLLKDVGIELSGKPEVLEIHNILER